MSQKPETKLVKRIVDNLSLKGCVSFKIHGGMMQRVGIPDILACYRGRLIAIEAKMPGNKPEPIQRYILDQINKAGGFAIVAYDDIAPLELLDQIDSIIEGGKE